MLWLSDGSRGRDRLNLPQWDQSLIEFALSGLTLLDLVQQHEAIPLESEFATTYGELGSKTSCYCFFDFTK